MNNLLDLFTSTEQMGLIFVNMEIVKTFLKVLFYFAFILINLIFVKNFNDTFQTLCRNNEDNKHALNKCCIKILITLALLIFLVFKFISNTYYLIECFLNPQYIYLRHLINLMR